MGEFELIRRFFQPLAVQTRNSTLVLGPGDDCAVQAMPPNHELVFSVDTLVEGVHFPRAYPPRHLGWRSLAVATSDLAAAGADPACFTLALTLPESDERWLTAFAEGLGEAARSFGLALAGGDITRGPLNLSIQVHGSVPRGAALLRNGARPGDLICVSGTLGDAGAALDYLDCDHPDADREIVMGRYHRPEPRLQLGQWLRGRASAVIDVSDGLLADLGHLLRASGAGARLDCRSLPVSAALQRLRPDSARQFALSAGDDYELCFTLSPRAWERLGWRDALPLTVIGEVCPGSELVLADETGERLADLTGYDHFRNPDGKTA